jgi:hypothetical protein
MTLVPACCGPLKGVDPAHLLDFSPCTSDLRLEVKYATVYSSLLRTIPLDLEGGKRFEETKLATYRSTMCTGPRCSKSGLTLPTFCHGSLPRSSCLCFSCPCCSCPVMWRVSEWTGEKQLGNKDVKIQSLFYFSNQGSEICTHSWLS